MCHLLIPEEYGRETNKCQHFYCVHKDTPWQYVNKLDNSIASYEYRFFLKEHNQEWK